ncbi:MAG: hypothetical protein JW741_05790 [Sedimentisphaerales bacterium]|nr:hypothetical protein [Sedimentisphaerales bacterium]
MDRFLEHMGRKGLIGGGTVNDEQIRCLSKSKILNIAEDLASLTPSPEESVLNPPITHCASISLGGGRDDCEFLECRRTRLDSLARFAAFYSDRVFVRNFFCDYEHRRERSIDDLRMTLHDDIALILHIAPLLAQRLLILASEKRLCPNCLGQALGFGSKCGREFHHAWNDLADEFLDSVVPTAVQKGRWIVIKVSCPEPYSECGQVVVYNEVPRPFQARPRIMAQLSKGAKVKLSKTMIRALKIHHDLAGKVVHSVAYHAIMNRCLKASFLTNKELELVFLNKASGDIALERRNAIAMKHLTALVPFVIDVPVSKLSKLREREAESFVRFRSAFNRVLSEYGDQKRGLSAKVARELYGDVLAPELARLDQKVKRSKQDLVSATARPLAGMVGAISFGLLSGLIPAEIAQLAQTIGIASFGSTFLERLMALGDAEKTVQQDDFYFLWKVRKLAKRRKT